MSKNKIMKLMCFILLLVFGFVIFIYYKTILDVLMPLIVGLVIAYILKPVVENLMKNKINRIASISIIYSIFFILMLLFFLYIIPQIYNSIKDLTVIIPDYFERYKILLQEFIIRYRYSAMPDSIKSILDKSILNIENYILNILNTFIEGSFKSINIIINAILGIIISIYILADYESIKRNIKNLIPDNKKKSVLSFVNEINLVLSGFVRGQIYISLLLSVGTIAGLLILKIKYALILGIVAGFTNLIPYFGPIFGAVPAVIVALLDKPIKAIWVIILYIVLQQIESAILSPRIVGRRVGLHPVISIIAIYAGGKLFGFIGLLVIVPIVGILKVILKRGIKWCIINLT